MHPRAARRLTFAGVAAVTLLGCYPMATPPVAPPAGTPTVQGEAEFGQSLMVDIDPLRGAAFERPTRHVMQAVNVTGALRVGVEFPQVTHDPATGRTTVTMQITNAGDSLTYLKCNVGGDRKVVSPAYGFNTTIAKAGATQTVDLVFENSGGGGFTANFTFTGTLNPRASLPVGSSPTGSPSPAPTATPTSAPTIAPSASPTAAPTASPTVAPTPTPAPTATPTSPTGSLTASASTSYGSLTPERVLDGDLASQWSNDGYQAPEAWLRLDAGTAKPIASLGIKMRPQSGGAYYVIETSNDGTSFTPASGQLKNTSWNVETKPLNAATSARYVRLRMVNDPASPEVRFSVFEVQWNGTANTGGSTPAASPTPTPTPTPTATPTPAPSTTSGRYVNNFEGVALGAEPSDFIDPRDEGYSYEWLVDAPWRIASHNGSKQFMHDGLSNYANLSFRRYKGNAFGANGVMPTRYFTEVEVTPIKSYTYNPTGDQGTQQYYLNPTNYVELVIKPNLFEAWVANNAQPFTGAGWQRLYYQNLNTAGGQTRKIGTEIDTEAHTMKIYLDGAYVATITTSKLDNRAHYFALRGTGNIVTHDNLVIESR
jgi:hypothetical protein